ncbi:MAG: hypothetical protein ACI84R_003727 [Candidatus Azotimanducaceae bacterium]|jgi:hypothetical protein
MTNTHTKPINASKTSAQSTKLKTLQAELATMKDTNLQILAIMQTAMVAIEQIKKATQTDQSELKKRRALEAQIKKIHASTSWRVTAPLRVVRRKLRRT